MADNKKLESTSKTIENSSYKWADDYSPEFEPNNKKLYKLHKVPQFKRRFVDEW